MFEVDTAWQVQAAPDCPSSIMRDQCGLSVAYVDFAGSERRGIIEVNQQVVDDLIAFFAEAFRLRFPFHDIVPASDYGWDDGALMAGNVTSGFNYRTIAGSAQVSLHGLGRAIDVNPFQNPYIRYNGDDVIISPAGGEWHPERPGTLYAGHPLVRLLVGRDWEWGGDWRPVSGRTDYQHLQKRS